MADREVPTKARPYRPAEVGGAEVPCIVVLTGSRAGTLLELAPGTNVVGRGEDAPIRLDDDGVSRTHARFMVGPDGAVSLVDLGSTNGTFVNGAKAQQLALRDGDRIQVGPDVTLKFTVRTRAELSGGADEPAPEPLPLSDRELEVAQMVAQGMSNAEIGQRLHISPRTVGTHLSRIYDRLQVHSRAALTRFIMQRGLGGSTV